MSNFIQSVDGLSRIPDLIRPTSAVKQSAVVGCLLPKMDLHENNLTTCVKGNQWKQSIVHTSAYISR